MASSPIGEIPIVISGDYSELSTAIDQATRTAEAGAKEIADAFKIPEFDVTGITQNLETLSGTVQSTAQESGSALGTLSAQLNLFGDTYQQTAQLSQQIPLFDVNSIEAVDTAFGSLGQTLNQNKESVQQYSAGAQQLVDAQKAADRELEQAREVLAEVEAAYKRGAVSAEVLARAEHQVEEAGHAAAGGLHETEKGIGGMAEKLVQLGEALVIVEGLREFASEAIHAFDAVHEFGEAMTFLTGNVEEAEVALKGIEDIAKTQPFTFAELSGTTQKLTAFGVEVERIPGLMQAAANAASATGNSFEGVAQALGRVYQSGQVSTRQFVQLGINIKDVAKTMGMSIDQANEALKRGVLQSDTLIGILQTTIQNKFSGASKLLAEGVLDTFKVIQNQIHQLMAGLGEEIAPFVVAIEQGFLNRVIPALRDALGWFKQLPTVIKEIAIVAAAALPVIAAFSIAVGVFGTQIAAALAVAWPLTVALAAIGAAAAAVHFSGLDEDFMTLVGAIKSNLGPLVAMFKGWATDIRDIGKAIGEVIDSVPGLRTAIEVVTAAMTVMRENAPTLRNLAKDVEYLGGVYKSMGDSAVSNIKRVTAVGNDWINQLRDQATEIGQKQSAAALQVKIAADMAAAAAKIAAQQIAEELKKFDESTATLLSKLPSTYQTYINALSQGGKEAKTLLGEVQNQIDNATALMSKMSTIPTKLLQEFGKLVQVKDLLKGLADTDAFFRLGQKVDEIATQYPAQIAKLDTATRNWIATMQDAAKQIPAALNKITDADLLERFAKSQHEVDESSKALNKTLMDGSKGIYEQTLKIQEGFDGVGKKVKEQIPIVIEFQNQLTGTAKVIIGQYFAVQDAFHRLGVSSQADLDAVAKQAILDYQKIKDAGLATTRAGERAWLAMTDAQINAGATLTLRTALQYDELERKTREHTSRMTAMWLNMVRDIKAALTQDLSQAMTDVIFHIDKIGDDFKRMAEDIVGAIIHRIIENGINKLVDSLMNMSGILGNVGGGLGGGGGVGGILAPTIGGTRFGFAVGGGAGEAIGTIDHTIAGTAGAAKAGSGAASGAAGAAGAGATGVVGAVAGVVSAVSDVIGIFQNMHQETSLNAIEHNTRYSMMYLGERAGGGILGVLFRVLDTLQFGNIVQVPEQIRGRLDTLISSIGKLTIPNVNVILGSASVADTFRSMLAMLSTINTTLVNGFDKLLSTLLNISPAGLTALAVSGQSTAGLDIIPSSSGPNTNYYVTISAPITINGARSPQQTAQALEKHLKGLSNRFKFSG